MQAHEVERQEQLEQQGHELGMAKAKATLHRAKAAAFSEQLFHLYDNLEESKNHQLKAKKKEAEGKSCQELLAAEVKCLKEELVSYKADEKRCWVNRKKAFLKSFEFFDLLCTRYAFLLEQDFNGAIQQFKEYPLPGALLDFLNIKKVVDNILEDKIIN